jgi:hypothetical protein
MAKRLSKAQKNLPPSKREYDLHLQVPDGCRDVWRINVVKENPYGKYTKTSTLIHSQWFDRQSAMEIADDLWYKDVGTSNPAYRKKFYHHVYVEHKAAILIEEKWHIVNIPSFSPGLSPAFATSDPDPDHRKWLSEYEDS